MLGDIEVDDTPAVLGEHDEDEEDTQAGWLRTIACPGVEELELQHLYRTVGGFWAAGRADLERALFSCSSGIATCSPRPILTGNTDDRTAFTQMIATCARAFRSAG
jgi:hypothetical protein